MSGSDSSKLVPVDDSLWRRGFFLLSIVTILLFLGSTLLLELARQAALQMDSIWLTINIANSVLPIVFGTAMTATVTGMMIVFACTHPRHESKDYGRSLSLSFIVFLYIAILWESRILLEATLDYSTSPPVYPISVAFMEIPLNMGMNLMFSVFLVFIIVYSWYRWLRPKE